MLKAGWVFRRKKLREVPLGKQFTLTATDKHSLGAYRADPAETPKGGMVVVQEIFGVNHHIRVVCDRLAVLGYVAVAPAVFDRFVRNFESGYTPDEIAHARSYLGNLNWEHMMADVAAAQGDLKGVGPLGVVGFCMGGTAAFLAACRIPGFSAAVAFYGGMIGKFADEKPKCPVQIDRKSTRLNFQSRRDLVCRLLLEKKKKKMVRLCGKTTNNKRKEKKDYIDDE